MLNYYGVFLGLALLILTALGHIGVIKGEYYFGTKIWIVFLIVGIASIVSSLIIKSRLLSGFFGIFGVTFLWGIPELFKQEKRVARGWFPKKK